MTKGFQVTVEGTVSVREANGDRELKGYQITVNVPHDNKLQWYLKNVILVPLLKKQFPNFYSLRTHNIIDHQPIGTDHQELTNDDLLDKNISFMNLDELRRYCVLTELPVEVGLYTNVIDLRKAVQDAFDNKELYLQKQSKLKDVSEYMSAVENMNASTNPVNTFGGEHDPLEELEDEVATPTTQKRRGRPPKSETAG